MPKKTKFTWNGAAVQATITNRIKAGIDEITLRVEAAAKEELQPGRGVLTGTLRRSIRSRAAVRRGPRIVGRVGTGKASIKYARVIERKYGYLRNGLRAIAPQAPSILARHLKK